MSDQVNVGLGFALGAIGSFSMATYTVPIKFHRVLERKVHPLIFQSYTSFWVFVTCWMFVIFNFMRSKPAFLFNYWAMLSAAVWIPSGLCTIASVQKIGVGMAAVLNTGISALVQFFVGQMLGEKMKVHGESPHEYVLYPYYLVAMMIGMAGLVLSPTLKFGGNKVRTSEGEPLRDTGESSTMPLKEVILGCLLAAMAGVFSGMQFGIKTIGKHATDPGCTDCDAHVHWENQFDGFGSFQVNFGIGTLLFTPIYLGLAGIPEKMQGKAMPSFHFDVMKIYGTIAGLCWAIGYVFQNRATSVGGISVLGPANQAMQLISAGLWSLIYYREVKDPMRIAAWVFFAVWTVFSVIMFGREKAPG